MVRCRTRELEKARLGAPHHVMGSHGGSDAVVGRGGRPDTWVTDSARAPRGPAALQPEPDGGLQPSTLVAVSQPAASIRQAIAIDPSIRHAVARGRARGSFRDGTPRRWRPPAGALRFALHRLATSKADPAGALLAFA